MKTAACTGTNTATRSAWTGEAMANAEGGSTATVQHEAQALHLPADLCTGFAVAWVMEGASVADACNDSPGMP